MLSADAALPGKGPDSVETADAQGMPDFAGAVVADQCQFDHRGAPGLRIFLLDARD